ncbi:hypothetical protein INR49_023659, partial [Caranx melampygus]
MDSMLDNLSKTEFISICVRNPRLYKDDLWHTHIEYEIFLQHVFSKEDFLCKTTVQELPKLPPWNPFFSLRNTEQVSQRMKGLQGFLESVLHTPLLLSDSRLHLFLQSDLSITKIERCALGKTRYTVAEAIQRSRNYSNGLEDKGSCDSDCESSSSSSGLGLSVDTTMRGSPLPFYESSDRDSELCSCHQDTPPPPPPPPPLLASLPE